MRRGGVNEDEEAGGDHARRELRRSWEGGSVMLRSISRVVRHRIWRRAPDRLAAWLADGEGRTRDVAGAVRIWDE